MHKRIIRPAEQDRLPRLLVYSRVKKGKTLFAHSAGQGNVLIMDPEFGTDWMKSSKLNPHVWPIDEWEDTEELLNYLRSDRHGYQWFSPDAMTKLYDLALKFITRIDPYADLTKRQAAITLPQRGKANELLMTFINRLHRLPIGVIYTAQERIVSNTTEIDGEKALAEGIESDLTENEEAPEETTLRYIPDLSDQVRRYLTSQVDVIGRLYVVKAKEEDKNTGEIVLRNQRRLWVAPHDAYDTGYRSCYTLPNYIAKPTVPKLVRILERGKLT
ncbi:MAG: AAA family ATPase [Gloeomargaritales cyanobacterium]